MKSRENIEAQLDYASVVDHTDVKWVFLYESFNDLPVENGKSHFYHKLALLMVDGVIDAGELFMSQAGVDSLGVYILFFLF